MCTGARLTITVELKPEVERELAHQAAARGWTYPHKPLRSTNKLRSRHQPQVQPPAKQLRPQGRKSLAELFADSPFRAPESRF